MTFSSNFRLNWIVGKSGILPYTLNSAQDWVHTHIPAPQLWAWSLSGLVDVGWPLEHIVQPLCWSGCRQEALTVGADGGVSLFSSLSPLVLCLEPNPLFSQCCWADTFWSMQKSHDPPGKEGWYNGVEAADRKYCALIHGKFFLHREKAERQQLFWRRSICGPGKYKICCAVRDILTRVSSACQKSRRAQDHRVRAWYQSAFWIAGSVFSWHWKTCLWISQSRWCRLVMSGVFFFTFISVNTSSAFS